MTIDHEALMRKALHQAAQAEAQGEVPVGAVLTSLVGEVLAVGGNGVIMQSDPTAHAEIVAIRRLAARVGNYRLPQTCLYVTIEPCCMCMGAIIHARIETVVFGAHDSKWGAAGSLYDFASDSRFNHRPRIIGGVCEKECRRLIQDFFRRRRV